MQKYVKPIGSIPILLNCESKDIMKLDNYKHGKVSVSFVIDKGTISTYSIRRDKVNNKRKLDFL